MEKKHLPWQRFARFRSPVVCWLTGIICGRYWPRRALAYGGAVIANIYIPKLAAARSGAILESHQHDPQFLPECLHLAMAQW